MRTKIESAIITELLNKISKGIEVTKCKVALKNFGVDTDITC